MNYTLNHIHAAIALNNPARDWRRRPSLGHTGSSWPDFWKTICRAIAKKNDEIHTSSILRPVSIGTIWLNEWQNVETKKFSVTTRIKMADRRDHERTWRVQRNYVMDEIYYAVSFAPRAGTLFIASVWARLAESSSYVISRTNKARYGSTCVDVV